MFRDGCTPRLRGKQVRILRGPATVFGKFCSMRKAATEKLGRQSRMMIHESGDLHELSAMWKESQAFRTAKSGCGFVPQPL